MSSTRPCCHHAAAAVEGQTRGVVIRRRRLEVLPWKLGLHATCTSAACQEKAGFILGASQLTTFVFSNI